MKVHHTTRATGMLQRASALLLCMALMAPVAPAQQGSNTQSGAVQPPVSQSETGFTFRVDSDLVLVSVTVRDKGGNLVRGLQKSDFTVLEDGKAQRVQTFDVEDVASFVPAAENTPAPAQAELQGSKPVAAAPLKALTHENLRDRRMIVLFLDLSSLESDDSDRAVESARHYVDKQMQPADLVSIVTFDTALKVVQDFTTDRKLLTTALNRVSGIEGAGQEQGTTGSSSGTAEDAGSFTADDTDYNIFNTDLRLQALTTVAKNLAGIDQKKSILYFSSGMTKTGVENQAQLRAAVNAAVRSNVAIYAVDSRGLVAMPPGGLATAASLRGQAAYSGAAVQSDLDANFASQETLVTLANDTGGKAFLDSNDFSKAYAKVQSDSESYYVLGYRSSNSARDGRFRHIQVKLNHSGDKLEYRAGYYGPRDFQHSTKEDREQQLQTELQSDLPETDLPVYLAAGYFRTAENKYYVPVSLVVPASALTVQRDRDKASLDVIGVVRDKNTRFPVGNLRDTIKLTQEQTASVASAPASAPAADSAALPVSINPAPAAGLAPAAGSAALPPAVNSTAPPPARPRHNVQYNTGFLLPPGSYHLKFVVRENQNGMLGSFETDLTVPDLHKEKLKLSSLILSSQKMAAARKPQPSPLVRDGQEIIPNLAHVFTTAQTATFFYEVYDPVRQAAEKNSIRLLTSIAFFRGRVKVYETPLVETTELNVPERKAAAFELEVPLEKLQTGWYTCQVNVIDDAGGTFAFPRVQLLVRP